MATADGTGRECARVVFTDAFVVRDSRWQAVHAQETPVLPKAPPK